MSNPRNATLPRGERLIIRISPGSLSFTTTGAGQVNYERYALKSSISMAANMREALRNTPVLEADYQHVAVMVDSPVLMMPSDLYNKDEQEELYGHTFTRLEGMTVVSYVLPSLNAVALFTIHRDLRQVLTERFNNLSLIPAVAPVKSSAFSRTVSSSVTPTPLAMIPTMPYIICSRLGNSLGWNPVRTSYTCVATCPNASN